MQNFLKEENIKFKDPDALMIWNEIIRSLDEYPDDSILSKFFLPEQLTFQCRLIAAGITASLYRPILSEEEIFNQKIYHIILMATIWGMQTFLKEWSVIKNKRTYNIKYTKSEDLEKVRKKILNKLIKNVTVSKTPRLVLQKFIEKFSLIEKKNNFDLNDKVFIKKKYPTMLTAGVYWGYLFAKETISDKKLA